MIDSINDSSIVNVKNSCEVNVCTCIEIECGSPDTELACIVNVESTVMTEDLPCTVDEGKVCCVVVETES